MFRRTRFFFKREQRGGALMNGLADLAAAQPVAYAALILAGVAVCGLAIGHGAIGSVRPGVAGVLLAGIFFRHIRLTLPGETLGFLRDFGLLLFVYTTGVVLCGAILTIASSRLLHIDMAAAVGIFTGATTSTPSLGAAQEALKQMPGIDAGQPRESVPNFLNMKSKAGRNCDARSARVRVHRSQFPRYRRKPGGCLSGFSCCEREACLREMVRRLAVCLLVLLPPTAPAGERTSSLDRAKPELGDLSLSNFFSTGWNEAWRKRSRSEGTPEMSLLRVQVSFLATLFRTDYAHQDNLGTASVRGTDSLTGTLEYAFNRRLMLAVIGNYRRLDSRRNEDSEGSAAAAFVRLQWVETVTDSLAMTLRVGLPSHDFGERDTIVGLAIAGWKDLAPLGLKRTGLYYHVQEETLAGPGKPGDRRNDGTYAVSLAKTWTRRESFFGNATTFVEAYGKTDLDGKDSGHTVITVTPGIRATFAHRHIVMVGVDFPLTHPQAFERVFRFAYICSF